MFVSLPDYPRIEVWRASGSTQQTWRQRRSLESGGQGKGAIYTIQVQHQGGGIQTVSVHHWASGNAFITLLNHWEGEAWINFTGVGIPKEIRSGAPSIASGLSRRRRWWIRQGYKYLESLRQAQYESGRESHAKVEEMSPSTEARPENSGLQALTASSGHHPDQPLSSGRNAGPVDLHRNLHRADAGTGENSRERGQIERASDRGLAPKTRRALLVLDIVGSSIACRSRSGGYSGSSGKGSV